MALAALRDGNERVPKGTPRNCDRVAQAKASASGQAPIAGAMHDLATGKVTWL